MKITLNWLKQYVDYNKSPEDLKEDLTMLGMEVERMEQISSGFDKIVVAQIEESKPHPNADKLSVNRVNDGQGIRTIVCGAKNFKVGDKVPLALPGCIMPQSNPAEPPITIKVGKLRGIESQGMMCSARELGLSQDHSGLMILPQDAPVGQNFAEYIGHEAGDVIYDLEITPNRPDLNSIIGIAREISALTGNPLRIPEISEETLNLAEKDSEPVTQYVDVRIEDPELCPRYIARVIHGVKVGPSPDWLKTTLEKVGLRSISNIVDVTNYVMLETGQPLHAFDYHLLKCKEGQTRPTIVVRHAAEGEQFITLDKQEHTLSAEMQVIADETRATALAGVMGGLNTEINEQTVDVLLESAYFKAQNVRSTSKKLDLRTDASYRYERGADINICDYASRRAMQLIIETAGGKLAKGSVDVYPAPHKEKFITLRFRKTNELLGIEIPAEQQKQYLASLQLEPQPEETPETSTEQVTVKIPSYRVDLKRETDLIEEIGRLFGVNNIPSRLHVGTVGSNPYDSIVDDLSHARLLMSQMGLSEAQGQTLISKEDSQWIPNITPIELQNPISVDMDILRPSLLPGLLRCLTHNINHGTSDAALFEIGRIFLSDNSGTPTEHLRLSMAITGARRLAFWKASDERDAKYDLYDIKGILEDFSEHFGLKGLTFARATEEHPLFVEWGKILQGKTEFARFGQVHPLIARKMDLRDPVFVAEWNLDLVLSRRNPRHNFKSLNDFPGSRRDVSILVDPNTTHETVLVAIKKAHPENLESVQLFDIFTGKGVPEGKKSMAYSFFYRNSERTLTDEEVNNAHRKVLDSLQQNVRAILR